ncbi:dienelactone hydrolase family protein [Massilia sp. PAMC28688]|uniref:dienelactone hydrolase family protein n=1 Tax=Massilia sp. PAMC28688 TaxID=2861283 RepID=UPI001C62EE59|nr:dienelactone hydrolase family protein [Massilia sp. PAMC28688]QYF93623.1 dienelactone hydrolase family protein [Massilia sp. PAMC28688]
MKTPLIFVILFNVASFAAVATPVNPLIPEPGPHAVGLRIVQQYDYSRVLEAQSDVFGKTTRAESARPIQTLVWYPAARNTAAPMLIADYQQASLFETNFSFSATEVAKQRASWLASPRKALFSASTLAVRDATPSVGKFPVVIYAPSFASSAHENLDLAEYLASHGYVVIASRSLGARSVMMTDDVEGVEAQAADIAFLSNYAHTLPQADISKVAAAGFSWGGMANVFAAAKSSRIKALVSLDGSIRFHPKIWGAASYVRATRTSVPMLFIGARAPTAEEMETSDKLGPSYLNTMKFSDVYVTTMHPMRHTNFNSLGMRFAQDASFGDYQRADVVQAYRSSVLYTHRFLDAYLKGDTASLAFLQQSPVKNGIGPQVMSMRYSPAAQEAPSEPAFLRAFAKAGFKDAQSIYTHMTASAPDFKLHPISLNLLGYQLLRADNARGAVDLFKLATYIEPTYGDAFDSEGEAYEAMGEKTLAIAAYEKAVAVDKDQANAANRIKALRAAR